MTVSEHLYLAARKRRYRRNNNDAPHHLDCVSIPMVFDRLEYLQQKIQTESLHKPVDMVLVTHDKYLSLALTQYLFKRLNTRVCASLAELKNWFEQTPLPHIVIDLDCVMQPIIDVLNTIRRWHLERPGINITLLTANRSPEQTCFIVAAAACRVIERRLETAFLCSLLMQQPCSVPPVQAYYTRENDTLSHREWNILMEVAKGHSLKLIAHTLKKPYHYVVYTQGRVTARVGLSSRKSLIHLLHDLSVTTFGEITQANLLNFE
ncbi:helix-turn-helix transcriptional regulator [Buttiauxella brennerae]|nr:hypothetical protein [Buttiauxella brennerae]